MISLYLARHGESELNVKKVYFGSTDCNLTEKGIYECKELKERLINTKFDVVISSNLKRALNSAEIVSNKIQDDIVIYEDLNEIDFGKWEKMNYTEIEKMYKLEWKNWINDWKNYAPPQGESFFYFYKRVKKCIEEILEKYKDNKILLVCHEGTLKLITVILLKLPLDAYWSFSFEYGKYSLFEIKDDFPVVRKINN